MVALADIVDSGDERIVVSLSWIRTREHAKQERAQEGLVLSDEFRSIVSITERIRIACSDVLSAVAISELQLTPKPINDRRPKSRLRRQLVVAEIEQNHDLARQGVR